MQKMSRRDRAALKRARRAAGLTQVQLANELGVDPVTVSRWERGESVPSKHVMPKLADRFPDVFGAREAA